MGGNSRPAGFPGGSGACGGQAEQDEHCPGQRQNLSAEAYRHEQKAEVEGSQKVHSVDLGQRKGEGAEGWNYESQSDPEWEEVLLQGEGGSTEAEQNEAFSEAG